MKKIILIVIDGLGDRPIKELGNKTPLEKAQTPNLDYLAQNGLCGQVLPFLYQTAIPTSEQGHFSLFGYSPKVYQIKRGIFTAQGAGLKLKKGDLALRGNFGTVDENLNMIDRRAGRIKNTQPLIRSLNGMVIDDGVRVLVKTAGGHRIGIVLRGKDLSSNISDSDPHYGRLGKRVQKVLPLDKTKKARYTAQVLNKFLKSAHLILKNHPLNKKRKKMGQPPANYILTRGASFLIKVPSFEKKYNLKACCVAGKPLYQQIGKILGMDLIKVKGANGLVNTNLKGKISAAQKALKRHDFVFIHIKATDSLAEDGNFKGKKKFIEKIDKNLRPLLGLKDTLIVVTADHSTCSDLKRHCKEEIPILISGARKDSVREFSERACQKGKLGRLKQLKVMSKILWLRGLAKD